MRQLHITNGDGAGELLKASAIDGNVLAWRDTMHDGPMPAGLDLEELSDVRARHLAGYGIAYDDVLRGFRERDAKLLTADSYDKVILWFEHDLLDQLQLLQLLDWFGGHSFPLEKLSLLCVDGFDGVENFRGLGQLTPDQIGSLDGMACAVTLAQIELATVGWAAFRSPDPRDLKQFLAGDTSDLPFLRAALHRHLQEYPWVSDGLTRTERQLLELVQGGEAEPGRLFSINMKRESVFYMGDLWTFAHVAALCAAEPALLACENGKFFQLPSAVAPPHDAFRAQRLVLTEAGCDVLGGDSHATGFVNRKDVWLGGVQLEANGQRWMWDDTSASLVQL